VLPSGPPPKPVRRPDASNRIHATRRRTRPAYRNIRLADLSPNLSLGPGPGLSPNLSLGLNLNLGLSELLGPGPGNVPGPHRGADRDLHPGHGPIIKDHAHHPP
jgi:hypothetical protein